MNASTSRRTRLPALCIALVTTAVAQTFAQCDPVWSRVTSPNVANRDNQLSKLAVIAPNDIWAVGNSATDLDHRQTLAMHWNGATWSIVPTPNLTGRTINWLIGVEAVASNNVWAVGYAGNSNDGAASTNRTLIMRWNGATWNIVSSPNPQPNNPDLGPYARANELFDLAVVSANDIWAVGHTYTFSNGQPLILHWNGTAWSNVPAPDTGDYGRLYSVDAVSANDVWAIGTEYHNGNQESIVHHWNGTAWSRVTSPNDGPFVQEWLSLNARAADDIWAVGYHNAVFGVNQRYQTSIMHYDGTSWSIVPSPDVNQENNYLWDVVALAKDNAYAVGFWDTGVAYMTMVQHWDGNAWSIVPGTPNPSDYWNSFYGVAAVSSNDVWAVGENFDGLFNFETFIAHFASPCTTGSTMHVADITPTFQTLSTGQFRVRATVTIRDAGNAAVAGAAVTTQIRTPNGQVITRTGTTNNNGLTAQTITSRQHGTYTVTVTNVSKAGSTYDPASNVETSDSVTIP